MFAKRQALHHKPVTTFDKLWYLVEIAKFKLMTSKYFVGSLGAPLKFEMGKKVLLYVTEKVP